VDNIIYKKIVKINYTVVKFHVGRFRDPPVENWNKNNRKYDKIIDYRQFAYIWIA